MAKPQYRVPCPHFPRCFGCPLIQLPYPQQLERKRALVREALRAYCGLLEVDVPAVIPSPRRLGYRGRVKLVVRRCRNEIAIGLYAPQSHRVFDISSCPVHPFSINQVLAYIKRKVVELEIVPYDERDDSGDLRYVDLRYSFSRREIIVTLVSRHAGFPRGERLARTLQRRFSFVIGVVQNVNESRGNVIWGDRYRTLAGRDTLLEEIAGFKIGFPGNVFSQANPATAQKLYQKIVSLASLTGRESVLDLYCGVAPISLPLARQALQVWGVDDSPDAIAAAKQNALRNGVGNCRFFAGDVAEKLTEAKRCLTNIDVAVLNPPRKGVQAAALEALLAAGPAQIIYVSCRPQSLARDLDRLVQAGYKIALLQPFDMFPQTDQVETVVRLDRN
jgi:23S rRNA (uracil1939-C5)-methyltransferase